jgi:hypothetical protein
MALRTVQSGLLQYSYPAQWILNFGRKSFLYVNYLLPGFEVYKRLLVIILLQCLRRYGESP